MKPLFMHTCWGSLDRKDTVSQPEFIPTAKAKRGKGPRTKKAARRRRGDTQAARDRLEAANRSRKKGDNTSATI